MDLWITREFEATQEEPNIKAWKMMENKIEVLNETPKSPNLRTLFLYKNWLEVTSDGNLGLRALPTGISKLISLECLDLSLTAISELPIELKSLTKLKALDLRCMNNLIKIPQHLISSFSRLQRIDELKGFQHLNVLWVQIKSMFSLERFLSFNLFRCLTLALLLIDFREPKVFDEMKMEKLHTWVSSCTNYTSNFHTLKMRLDIFGCDKMEEILNEGKFSEVASLETLELEFLPELKNDSEELKKLPLNSDSAKGNLLTIEGSEDWWARVERESEATRDAFLPSFKSIKY
ncbi:hypothetical protein GOBAR_DD27181 [Gossypium barbadense]|nr:hypothetical protein GOBAR_DD27181 [Gossypium barbadense]